MLNPAPVNKLTLPGFQGVCVVEEMLHILHMQTENILIPDQLFHFICYWLTPSWISCRQDHQLFWSSASFNTTFDLRAWNEHQHTPWWIHSRFPAEIVRWHMPPVVLKETDPVTEMCIIYFRKNRSAGLQNNILVDIWHVWNTCSCFIEQEESVSATVPGRVTTLVDFWDTLLLTLGHSTTDDGFCSTLLGDWSEGKMDESHYSILSLSSPPL